MVHAQLFMRRARSQLRGARRKVQSSVCERFTVTQAVLCTSKATDRLSGTFLSTRAFRASWSSAFSFLVVRGGEILGENSVKRSRGLFSRGPQTADLNQPLKGKGCTKMPGFSGGYGGVATIDIAAPSMKRLMSVKCGLQPPIGASPGELRLWMKMNGLLDEPTAMLRRPAKPNPRLPPLAPIQDNGARGSARGLGNAKAEAAAVKAEVEAQAKAEEAAAKKEARRKAAAQAKREAKVKAADEARAAAETTAAAERKADRKAAIARAEAEAAAAAEAAVAAVAAVVASDPAVAEADMASYEMDDTPFEVDGESMEVPHDVELA